MNRDGKEAKRSKNEPNQNTGFAKNRTEPESKKMGKNPNQTKPNPVKQRTDLEPNILGSFPSLHIWTQRELVATNSVHEYVTRNTLCKVVTPLLRVAILSYLRTTTENEYESTSTTRTQRGTHRNEQYMNPRNTKHVARSSDRYCDLLRIFERLPSLWRSFSFSRSRFCSYVWASFNSDCSWTGFISSHSFISLQTHDHSRTSSKKFSLGDNLTIGYSKENLKIHMGSLPSLPYPPLLPPLPSPPCPLPSLPISPSIRSKAP